MKKGYINVPDKDLYLSTYNVIIEYKDGEIKEEEIAQYSYSDVFEVIKERHEDEKDKAVKSIKINLVK